MRRVIASCLDVVAYLALVMFAVWCFMVSFGFEPFGLGRGAAAMIFSIGVTARVLKYILLRA